MIFFILMVRKNYHDGEELSREEKYVMLEDILTRLTRGRLENIFCKHCSETNPDSIKEWSKACLEYIEFIESIPHEARNNLLNYCEDCRKRKLRYSGEYSEPIH